MKARRIAPNGEPVDEPIATHTVTITDVLPISLNDRQHWRARARHTAAWRDAVGWQARAANIPRYERISVRLEVYPPDRRRRDRHNLVPVLKAAVDGLVDAEVIPDDTPEHLVDEEIVLHEPLGDRRWTWHIVVEARA